MTRTKATSHSGGTPPRDAKAAVDVEARIISIGEEQGRVWSALLLAPEIAERAKPMQFVQVKVGIGTDPFLRRPFGISHIYKESGLIAITWAIVGKGTAIMADLGVDDTLEVLGPLGNGFDPGQMPSVPASRPAWLIAGGTGLAPLYPLAQAFRRLGHEVTVFYGARSRDLLMDTSKFEHLGCEVFLCTEDGSAGVKGFVTATVRNSLERTGPPPLAVACGPTPMLRAVKAQLAETDIDLYVSLEERMACGTGLCKGCAVKAAPPRGGYVHVCSDGPVFAAGDVILGGEK